MKHIINNRLLHTAGVLLFIFNIQLSHADSNLWDQPIADIDNAGALNNVTESLNALSILRSNFVQTRNMSFLKRPLTTQGNFVYSKSHGLYWEISKPYHSVHIITRQGVYLFDKEKGRIPTKSGGEQVFKKTALLFSSIFTADLVELEKTFQIYFSGNAENWTIGLKPKKRIIKNLIDNIVINGSTYVSKLTIHEKSKDNIQIEFLNMSSQPGKLSETELIYFAE